jgi:glycosyltransferase involved in cell wall biosynthesis
MKIAVFLNELGLGGTEKAACRWAWGLKERGHRVVVLALHDGPRRAELEQHRVDVRLLKASAAGIADSLREVSVEAIHAHVPGHPHEGDMLGAALELLPKKIPVVQTNIFGQLYNPKEDAWTGFRLFVSWTSCVQAARRAFRPLDEHFFRRASVAVYPVDALDQPTGQEIRAFRRELGVSDTEHLFGRLSRPEPNKWTPLLLDAFQTALRRNDAIKLLLREPPQRVAERIRALPRADRFVILPATGDAAELRRTMAALDIVLHTSSIGESFGYGIAEPMNLGRPVISHSVPWQDQAQIELVRHGECGFIASTPATMADAILKLAGDGVLRERMGEAARWHIRAVADPATSITRIERALALAVRGDDNPDAATDLQCARRAAAYLDAHQFGHSAGETLALWPRYVRTRFHQLRQRLRQLLYARR